MVYFTEKLIHEIRRRSCIWDTADVNHLNKEVLTNVWMDIAENLYSDWHALGAFDRRDRVADVKKKWTNIKDSFVKDVKGKKPRKSRGPPEHRKKYYLFDHLQFLIPFIQDSKVGNGSRSAGGEPKKKPRKNVSPAEGASPSWSRAHQTPAAGKHETPAAADVQHHADALNNVAGKSASDALCQLDGDLSFMVSLLPAVKTMNEKQKIDFKIGVLQLLARIKFSDALQHSAACQPFVAPDLRCFPVPYPPGIPFPFVGSQAAAVSSTQRQQRQHRTATDTTAAAATMSSSSACDAPVKRETTVDSSPPTSSLFESDLEHLDEDDDDDEDEDDDGNDDDDDDSDN